MAVITKYKNLKSKTIIQYNNELKTLESVNVDDSYIKSQVIVKAPVTSDELSSEKVTVYKDVVVQPDNNDTLITVDKFKGQLVKPIIDASTIIDNPKWLIKDPILDSSLNWRPVTPDTENAVVYTNFPVNGRPATWIDLISNIKPSENFYRPELEELLKNNTYEVFLGTELVVLVPGRGEVKVLVSNNCIDCDTFENITFSKILNVCRPIYKNSEDANITKDTAFEYEFSVKVDNNFYPGATLCFLLNQIEYYKANPNIEIPLCDFVYHELKLYSDTDNIVLGWDTVTGFKLGYVPLTLIIAGDRLHYYGIIQDISKLSTYDNNIINYTRFKKFPSFYYIDAYHYFNYEIVTTIEGMPIYTGLKVIYDTGGVLPNLCICRDVCENGLINHFRIIPNTPIYLLLVTSWHDKTALSYINEKSSVRIISANNISNTLQITLYAVGYAIGISIGGTTTDGLTPTIESMTFTNVWILTNSSNSWMDPRCIMEYGNTNWFFWPERVKEVNYQYAHIDKYIFNDWTELLPIYITVPIDPELLIKSNLTLQILIIKFLHKDKYTISTYEPVKIIIVPFSKLSTYATLLYHLVTLLPVENKKVRLEKNNHWIIDPLYIGKGDPQKDQLWYKNLADVICPHIDESAIYDSIGGDLWKEFPTEMNTYLYSYSFSEIVSMYGINKNIQFTINAFKYDSVI